MTLRRKIIRKIVDRLEDPVDLADLMTLVEAQATSRRHQWFTFLQEMTVFLTFTGVAIFFGSIHAWWAGAAVMGTLASTLSIASYKRWDVQKRSTEESRLIDHS